MCAPQSLALQKSGEKKPLFQLGLFLAIKENTMSGTNHLITLISSSQEHHSHSETWCYCSMLRGCFSSTGTRKLVNIEGMIDDTKYREILEKKLFQSSTVMRLGHRFTFQQDNYPKQSAETALKRYECVRIALTKLKPQSNWESVAWLIDLCTAA